MAKILSVSLPDDLPVRLSAEARRQRRSRSFVVAEALREYLARRDAADFTEAGERTLREGLALSAAERLALSERLWRELARRHEPDRPWTAAFDTFEQYETWRRGGGARGG
jgi:predicted transcriptional regulator